MQSFVQYPFTPPPGAAALRERIRGFLRDHLPEAPAAQRINCWAAPDRAFSEALGEAGFIGMIWPKRYGGHERHPLERYIVLEELLAAGAPVGLHWIADRQTGALLLRYGTEAQRQAYLPEIAKGRLYCCIGMSEPGAGSDLAAVRTRAIRTDEGWRINGQKLWTTNAHHSRLMIALVRTGAGSERQEGLTQFLIDLTLPGVAVRPIVDLAGGTEFNEVFFDGARTGASNVVGDVGGGWQVALATLAFERGVGMLGHLLSFRREFDRLGDLARSRGVDGDPVLRQRLAQAYIELSVMRCNTLRSLSGFDGPVAPPEASIGKLFWGSWHQRLGELAVDTAGVAATVLEGPDYELSPGQRTFLFSRAETIYGGSNQIQRNIIGERVLGLPPDPKVEASASSSRVKVGQP